MAQRAEPEPGRGLRVALLSFLIVMVDGYDSLMVSFVAPLLARHWALQPTDLGKVFAAGYLGAILGAIAMGPLADRVGRKPVLLAAMALACVATAACALAGSFEGLIALRFIAGLALGGALPAATALTAEHAPAKHRNAAVTLIYIGYPAGAVVGGAVTAPLLHLGWQAIFAGAAVACLLAFAIAWWLPESAPFRRAPAPGQTADRGARPGFAETFAEGRLVPTLTLWLGVFCLLLLTYFLVSWTPSLLAASGGGGALAAFGGVVLNLGGILGALVLTPVVRRFGPYRPVAVTAAVGALLVAVLGRSLHAPAVTMALLFAVGACVIGGQLNTPAMAVALYPARVRGSGSGWALGVGRIGSIVGPMAGGALMAHLPLSRMLLFAAVPALVAALAFAAAALLQPRTAPIP